MSLPTYKCCRGFRIPPHFTQILRTNSEKKIHTAFFITKFVETDIFADTLAGIKSNCCFNAMDFK